VNFLDKNKNNKKLALNGISVGDCVIWNYSKLRNLVLTTGFGNFWPMEKTQSDLLAVSGILS